MISQNGFSIRFLIKKTSLRAWYGRYNPEYLTRYADLFTSQSGCSKL